MRTGALAAVPVDAVDAVAPGVYSLRFRRNFPFTPGECLPVAADEGMAPRRYSLASGPGDAEAELLFDLVAEGRLTPWLARLAPGDVVRVGAPSGSFRDAEGPAVWIAAGTGIAPFLSMVRAGHRRDRRLVHGSRTLAGFLYRGELETALGASYMPCCSAEGGDGVFPGRLSRWLLTAALDPEARYLLCGSPAMVVDVRALLMGRGVPYEHILAEIYF